MCPRTDKQFQEMRESTKTKILDSAMVLFSQKGFHGTSMDSVARKAKVSKGLSYNYFRSKEEILATIIEKRLNEVGNLLDKVPEEVSPQQKLSFLIKEMLTDVANNVELYRLYFSIFLQPGITPAISKMITKIQSRSGAIGERINNIFESLGVSNPEMEAILFFSTIQGVAMDFIIAPDLYPISEMIKYISKKYRGKNELRYKKNS